MNPFSPTNAAWILIWLGVIFGLIFGVTRLGGWFMDKSLQWVTRRNRR